uniref:Protocadherin-15, LHFPL tetraspan subfamily member, LHFPL5, protocadherin, tip link n=1 Tax=Myoviridae sp. ctZgq1 TaxID=2826666 RepID=A0A8S5LX30_9CAUD|nr:MAG TPA: Protocadherin-15, LHFPL tetraspan subfamily member, LHFPL5, protocadherin, tip link [Myoviridae sp. ctZgq1]
MLLDILSIILGIAFTMLSALLFVGIIFSIVYVCRKIKKYE